MTCTVAILQEIWNKHKCTGNHISFHVFVVYWGMFLQKGNVFLRHKCSSVRQEGALSTFVLMSISIRLAITVLSQCLQ